MSELKTRANDDDVQAFLRQVEDETKRNDSFELLRIMQEQTGEAPRMWGASIIGFGQYHYKSERSSQEGDWPLIGFSPRKQNLTVYIMQGFDDYREQLSRLGRHTTSKGCLYIRTLADVDSRELAAFVRTAYADMQKAHKQ